MPSLLRILGPLTALTLLACGRSRGIGVDHGPAPGPQPAAPVECLVLASSDGGLPPLTGCDGGYPCVEDVAELGSFASPSAPAVLGDRLVWLDDVGVGSRLLPAGDVVGLTADISGTHALALRGDTLFVGTERGAIFRLRPDCAPPVNIAAGHDPIASVVATDAGLFFTQHGSILVAPPGGGISVPLTSALSMPTSLAVDDRYVYWADLVAQSVGRIQLDGGGFEILAANRPGPSVLALDGDVLFWVDGLNPATIVRFDLSTADLTELASFQGNVSALALDHRNVYFGVDNPPDSEIVAVPRVGGAPTVLATGVSGPSGIAVDGRFLYWTESYSARVRRMRLPDADGG